LHHKPDGRRRLEVVRRRLEQALPQRLGVTSGDRPQLSLKASERPDEGVAGERVARRGDGGERRLQPHAPDEMSAEQHRAEVAKHAEAARREEAQAIPTRTPRNPRPPTGTPGPGQVPLSELWDYNPSELHQYNAEREREHAREHHKAAEALERSEAQACEGVPKAARAPCPLLTPFVRTVEETQRGAILHLKDPEETRPLAARMQCHLAFARSRAFDPKLACPLYERNVEIRAGSAPATIRIEGRTQDAAARVRADLRRLFGASRAR
jgi:hypothetical protein